MPEFGGFSALADEAIDRITSHIYTDKAHTDYTHDQLEDDITFIFLLITGEVRQTLADFMALTVLQEGCYKRYMKAVKTAGKDGTEYDHMEKLIETIHEQKQTYGDEVPAKDLESIQPYAGEIVTRLSKQLGLPITEQNTRRGVLQTPQTDEIILTTLKGAKVDNMTGAVTVPGTKFIQIEPDRIDKPFNELTQDLGTPAQKTFLYLMEIFTRNVSGSGKTTLDELNNARIIDIPLKDYMQDFNLKDRKHAKSQLLKSVKAIRALSVHYHGNVYSKRINPKTGKLKSYTDQADIDEYVLDRIITTKRGHIIVEMSETLAKYMHKNGHYMALPNGIYKLNGTALHVCYYLALNARRATGGYRKAHKSNIIQEDGRYTACVATLLSKCPNIPTYLEVMGAKGDRHIKQRIIEPLDKALQKLEEDGLITFEYSNTNGQPLTEEQIENYLDDWETFKELNITYTITDDTYAITEEDRQKAEIALKQEAKAYKKELAKEKAKQKVKAEKKKGTA